MTTEDPEMASVLDPLLRTGATIALQGIQTLGKVTAVVFSPLSGDPRYDQLRRDAARTLARMLDVPEAITTAAGVGAPVARARAALEEPQPDERVVRRRFEDLLSQSTDIHHEDGEPALLHVVDELSPDEARILRLLHREGPAPYVDLVRVSVLGGGSDAVLYHLSMVGERAGCRHPDRTQFYLMNLQRLGLVVLPKEPVEGHDDYGLLEGHPDLIAAARTVREDRGRRPRMRKGQVRLTAMGLHLAHLVFDEPGAPRG